MFHKSNLPKIGAGTSAGDAEMTVAEMVCVFAGIFGNFVGGAAPGPQIVIQFGRETPTEFTVVQ
ncbi:hypothetical protein KXD96_07270 [Mycobacterium sp. SMC-2]|uniref:hypothetical protein n=1 Tax=Mycobacterium sp. SMC-2 TaxID=2857058 RepID=UPI0021B1635C|nr:hypothetical protein [Mycobacterium sp. SMC-2]UXA07902.1 hypothetical protein KXD96_07270 [Mycobacterium sp. SMC-2]